MIVIASAVVICFFVGVGCYQWGYNKAVEKRERRHKQEIVELKKQHREEISNLYKRINEKEQD